MGAERRKHPRTRMILPLRAFLSTDGGAAKPVEFVHTLDVGQVGARLGGLRSCLKLGETITLQRGQQKAKFKVVWIHQVGANEVQAGVEALNGSPDFWGVDLSADRAAKEPGMGLLLKVLKAGK